MSSPRRAARRKNSSAEPRGWRDWLAELWPWERTRNPESLRLFQDYTRSCQDTYGKNYVYMPKGDLRDLHTELWDSKQCIERYGKNRKQKVELPHWREFDESPVAHEGDTDLVRVHLERIAEARRRGVRAAIAPTSAYLDPSQSFMDDTLGPAMLSSPASSQRLLFNYFSGVGTKGTKNLQHDWREAMGLTNQGLPVTTCGMGPPKMKLHQATVFAQMRVWAAAQGMGAEFDSSASPKGFLALHSTGSGKTCLAAAVYQAYWAQTLTNGEARPLMLFTTPANRNKIQKKGKDKPTDYYNCARTMFPSSPAAKMSVEQYGKRVKLYSFTEAGNRLHGTSSEATSFRANVKHAVIVIDEAQSIFAPDAQFAVQAAELRKWLLNPESDGATIVIMTATPGSTVSELFELLNCMRRSSEGQLHESDFVDSHSVLRPSSAAAFRHEVAGRVSFVDYRNNTNDYPAMRTSVESVEMSDEQRESWIKKVKMSKGAVLETSSDWTHTTEGVRLRRESNMANSWHASNAFGSHTVKARAVYASGDLRELHKYSAKLVRAIENIESPANAGKKQYLYSAFKDGGISQITSALQGRGWTNMYASMGKLSAAMAAVKESSSKAAADALERILTSLPGVAGKRFLSTADWGSTPPKSPLKASHSPKRITGGAAQKSPKRKQSVTLFEEEDAEPVNAKAEAQAQALATEVYNSPENLRGRIVNLLLATGKYNEGLDLKAVRMMHMFEPQTSMAAERQMEGRGRRYCSHTDLPSSERDVEVVHYFAEVEGEDAHALVNEINELQAQARKEEEIAEAARLRVRIGRAEMHRLISQGKSGLSAGMLSTLQNWFASRPAVDSHELAEVTDDQVRLARVAEDAINTRMRGYHDRKQAVPVQLHIEAVNAKDKRAFLEGLRGHSAPLKAALDRLKKRASGREAQLVLADFERDEARAFAEGERAMAAARTHSAAAAAKVAKLKRQDPSLMELLNESAPSAASGMMATDLLVHGIARHEGAPMASFLQALADSATDCMVLQTLHARMGVRAQCKV